MYMVRVTTTWQEQKIEFQSDNLAAYLASFDLMREELLAQANVFAAIQQRGHALYLDVDIPYEYPESTRDIFIKLNSLNYSNISHIRIRSDSMVIIPAAFHGPVHYNAEVFTYLAEFMLQRPKIVVILQRFIEWHESIYKLLNPHIMLRIDIDIAGYLRDDLLTLEELRQGHLYHGDVRVTVPFPEPRFLKCPGIFRFLFLYMEATKAFKAQLGNSLDNYDMSMAFLDYIWQAVADTACEDLAAQMVFEQYISAVARLKQLQQDSGFYLTAQAPTSQKILRLNKMQPNMQRSEFFTEIAKGTMLYAWRRSMRLPLPAEQSNALQLEEEKQQRDVVLSDSLNLRI